MTWFFVFLFLVKDLGCAPGWRKKSGKRGRGRRREDGGRECTLLGWVQRETAGLILGRPLLLGGGGGASVPLSEESMRKKRMIS